MCQLVHMSSVEFKYQFCQMKIATSKEYSITHFDLFTLDVRAPKHTGK